MMDVITRSTFPFSDSRWCGLLACGRSAPFRALYLVLAVSLGGASLVRAATATWNPNPETDIAGYILSYGMQPGVHPNSVNVGNVTTYQITTLTPGQTYYFVVQAY